MKRREGHSFVWLGGICATPWLDEMFLYKLKPVQSYRVNLMCPEKTKVIGKKCQIRQEVKQEVWGPPAEGGKKEQSPNHLGVMVCEANISSVSAEPWRRDGGGSLVVGVMLGGGGVQEWVTCNGERYIVAIPHSLHHLQLLLPITPPSHPNSPRGQSQPLAPWLKWSG